MAFDLVELAAADSKCREVPEQISLPAHKRAVLAPVVISVMFRSGLLGGASMDQML